MATSTLPIRAVSSTPDSRQAAHHPAVVKASPPPSEPSVIQAIRPDTRSQFEIAIICALTLEADAVNALFDNHWDDDGSYYGKANGDPNSYSTGSLGRHNVVLAHMPGMGSSPATAVASWLRVSFPKIRLALVVGICGLVPSDPDGRVDMFLGDVVVSDGVIQYDFGRQLPDQFKRKETLLDSPGRPNVEIRALLAKLKGLRGRRILTEKMLRHLKDLQATPEIDAQYPGAHNDQLYQSTYNHLQQGVSCDECGCNSDQLSRRRSEQETVPPPTVHFGLLASGNTVMKSAADRDRIAEHENTIAFEMEGAGVWDTFPCVVIKGGCDYADSHKTKSWQRYAAATAAACTKAFLEYWTAPSAIVTHQFGISEAKPAPGRHVSIPFERNSNFTGREDMTQKLRSKLFDKNSPQRVALVGLGGVGKTQVAIHMAYWAVDNMPGWSVFWLPAISAAAFEQACAQLVRDRQIARPNDEDPKESLQQYLSSSRSGQWLFILDNADDKEITSGTSQFSGIFKYLPRGSHGRILVTTRSRDVGFTAAGNSMLELKAMSEEDAKNFFLKMLPEDTPEPDPATVTSLLKELTYLPLAISQAAAYITVNVTTISEYLALLQDTEEEAIGLLSIEFADQSRYEDSEHAVAATWLVSFRQIRKINPPAAELLSFMSQIEPRAIPTSMLPPTERKGDLTRAVGTLSGYAFVQRRWTEDGELLDMHRLVHLAAQLWVAQEHEMPTARRTALKHLETVFNSDRWEDRHWWRQYLPHVLKIIQSRGELADWGEDECTIGNWAGRCLHRDNRPAQAIELLEHNVRVREATLPEEHPDRLASQHNLALAYQNNGQVKDALCLLQHVVRVEEATLSEDHPDRLTSQHSLASAYQDNGQVKEAIELLEHVVRVRETLSEDHPTRLASQHSLALAYRDNGQVKEAIELLEYIVRVQEALSEDHPDRLISQHNLALAYEDKGDSTKAISLLEYVVDIRSQILSPTHPLRRQSEFELARMKAKYAIGGV